MDGEDYGPGVEDMLLGARHYATTVPEDDRPIYGAFFWLMGANYGMEPGDIYAMRGAGGQITIIVPSSRYPTP